MLVKLLALWLKASNGRKKPEKLFSGGERELLPPILVHNHII
jgi:hypothetical protein